MSLNSNGMKHLSLFIVLIILAIGCINQQTSSEEYITEQSEENYIKYATGFKVTYFKSIKLVKIVEPFKGATQGISYWLVPKGTTIPDSLLGKTIIRTPIENLVCTSTTHITPLDLLGISDKLIGFPSTQYISSELVRKQVENGITKEVGRDNNLNIEVMLDLNPEVLMTYSMTGDYSKLTPFDRSGIDGCMDA